MKLSFCCGILVLVLAATAPAQVTPPATPAPTPSAPSAPKEDRVILKVDGTPIYQSQIDEELQVVYGREIANFPPEQAEVNIRQLSKEIVNQLIGNILLANAALREGIKVSDAEVQQGMQQMAAAIVPNGNIDSFLKESGLTRERFTADMHTKMLAQRLVETKTVDLPPATDQEIKDFYAQNLETFRIPESVRASHILVRTLGIFDEDELAAKRDKAEALRKKLLEDKSVDFATLARENSDCPTAAKGGDLGQFARGEMVPEFEKAAFSQEVGAIGEMVKSNFGYHIIKVNAHEKERSLTLDEVKGWIGNKLLQERRQNKMREFVDQWRAAAKIEFTTPEAPTKPAATTESKPQ